MTRAVPRVLHRILTGYLSAFASLLKILGIIAVAAVLGFLVVWPLWYAAVHIPGLYTLLAIILIPSGMIVYAIIKRGRRENGSASRFALIMGKRILSVAVCLGLLMATLFFFMNFRIAAGILSGLILFFTVGYFSFAGR